MTFFSWHTAKQFQKFAIVGVTNTIIGYGVFFLFFHFFSLHYIFAAITGYIAGLLWGFFFNRAWTFQSIEKRRLHQFSLFASVYLISLVLSMLFLYFLVRTMGFDPRLANVFAIGLSTITNFFGCKFFVF